MNDVAPSRLDAGGPAPDAAGPLPADAGAEAASPEVVGAAPTEPGFGRLLAQAREQQGISIADIAARLRLHPRQVSALEEERLDTLPEAPFVRGFVRNYAKELKLDPAPLLALLAERLPAPAQPAEVMAGTGITASEVRAAGVDRMSRIAVIGGTVIVLVVLGLIGWVASMRMKTAEVARPAPAASAAVEAASPSPAASAPPADAAPATTVERPAQPAAAAAAQAGATVPADVIAPAAPAAPTAAPAPSTGLRLLIGERPSWVEITQADGRVLLTGLQEPGTERRLGSPQPPLQLVIGNASSVTLEYRGRTIDLKRHIRANDLARLTLE
jgi:cytoskeleton protein RodZ